MPESTELDDLRRQLQAYEALLAGMGNATGASAAMGVGGGGNMFGGTPQPNQPMLQTPTNRNAPGSDPYPVGGPGSPLLGPSYAPSGVIFGGGSPYPIDFGPARLQNALVGIRDLMNTPQGQQLIAKLKARFAAGGKGTP